MCKTGNHLSTFGDNVRNELTRNRKSISWLAKKSGVSQCMISYYLSGKAEPTLSRAIQISSALNISLSQLLGEDLFNPQILSSLVRDNEEAKNCLIASYSDTALLSEINKRLTQKNM